MKRDPRVHVRVYDDYETLSRAAADYFLSAARGAVEVRGRAAAALSGGATPKRMLALLAAAPLFDWSRVHFFWADERCVPPESGESNFKLANDALLAPLAVAQGNIHRIRGEVGAEQAAREYERELRSFFPEGDAPVFDLIVLGVGTDGHTASLFPGAAALAERSRQAVPLHFETAKRDRVTLTLAALNSGRDVLLLASGREKAPILHELLEDGNPRRCPAGLVKPTAGSVTWLIDREAARLLSL